MDKIYIDAAYKSINKYTEELCGDRVEIVRNDDRYIVVLSDGLGSGVKANILSTLTSKIISTMMDEGASLEDTVDTVVKTLPVCSVRKVAYSTFAILQISSSGETYLVEFDCPGCVFVHNGKLQKIEYSERTISGKKIKEANFKVCPGDILTLMSDGVVYAGIGALMSLGWTWENASSYIENKSREKLSAARITGALSDTCGQLYLNKPGDDTTVATVRILERMDVSILSGPPINSDDDARMVIDFMSVAGRKIVCGGTSANIVSRETGEPLIPSIVYTTPDIPPVAEIRGIDLVTEGVFTLKKTVEILKRYIAEPTEKETILMMDVGNGASELAKILIEECTHLNLFIGTKLNPAHQNSELPVDISIKLLILDELCILMEKIGRKVTKRYY